MLTIETEVRHIPDEVIQTMTAMSFNRGDTNLKGHTNFEMFMRLIPRRLEDYCLLDKSFERKYNEDEITAILTSTSDDIKKFQILIYEWGTSNQVRPRVRHLLQLLDKLQLFRVSNYLKKECNISVHQENNSITMTDTASAELPNLPIFQGSINPISESAVSSQVDLGQINIKKIDYNLLLQKTNNFSILLGKGGFGEVFKAIQLSETIEFAAVKRLTRIDERLFRKFLDELKLISGLIHPNITRLLGYSIDLNRSILCLVYEFVNDGSLKERIRKARNVLTEPKYYPFEIRVKHLLEVAEALSYLHNDKKLIHRDIKSENILLHNDEAKLCDFGLIRNINSLTETKAVGTQGYLAPEILNGDITEKSDIFSFGIVILETVTLLNVIDNTREDFHLGEFIKKKYQKFEIQGMDNIRMDEKEFDKHRLDLMLLAINCIEYEKSMRPIIYDVQQKLYQMKNLQAAI